MPARDPPGAPGAGPSPPPQHPGGPLAALATAPSPGLTLLEPQSTSRGTVSQTFPELGSRWRAGLHSDGLSHRVGRWVVTCDTSDSGTSQCLHAGQSGGRARLAVAAALHCLGTE